MGGVPHPGYKIKYHAPGDADWLETPDFDHLISHYVDRSFHDQRAAVSELRAELEKFPDLIAQARDRVAFYADGQANSRFAETALLLLREALNGLPEAACPTQAA